MTEGVAQKRWLSPFVMRYLAFPGWMIKLSKRQDGFLNKRVILFRLQYETHSLQMHPESPCRSVVALMPKLLKRWYALRLVVVPSQYLPSPSLFFQPIFPSLSSHIYFVAVPRILRRVSIPVFPHLQHHAHPPLSSPLTLSAISIIPNIRCASIVVLPHCCCGSHRIIFHGFVYFAAVVCNKLLAPLCSTPPSSLSDLFISLRFYFSIVTAILSLCDVLASLQSAAFFSTCLHFVLLQSDHPP